MGVINYEDFDFIGFSFNGKHSSDFGLLRVSDGDRYEDTLVPTLSNEASDVPGGIGQYYFGEQLKERKFSIKVAYDSISEIDKRRIRQWLHPDGELHELIFDERPYVKYWVKCSKEVTAKELCFNDIYYDRTTKKDKKRRVYKGELDIEFIAFMPLGIVVNKDLESYKDLYNIDEWSESSGLIEMSNYLSLTNFTRNIKTNSENKPVQYDTINIYNPGDIDSDFTLEFYKGSEFIYFTVDSQNGTKYNASNQYNQNLDFKSGDKIYGIYTGQPPASNGLNYSAFIPYLIEVKTVNNPSQGTHWATFEITNLLTNERAYPESLYVPIVTPTFMVFYLYDNKTYKVLNDYKLQVQFGTLAYTDPRDWSDLQKKLLLRGTIKIDTLKQTMTFTYKPDENKEITETIGIGNMRYAGNYFKLPIESEIGKTNITNSNLQYSFNIQTNTNTSIGDFNLNYDYLYI